MGRKTLYVSDLDGTLLGKDSLLTDFSRDTLNALLDEGLLFTVASARSVVTIGEVLRGLRLQLPVIEYNGAFLSDLATRRHRVVNALKPEQVRRVYQAILDHDCRPFVSSFDGVSDRVYYCEVANAGMADYVTNRTDARDERLTHVPDLAAYLDRAVVCFTVIDEEARLRALSARLEALAPGEIVSHLFCDAYHPEWFWLTIHDSSASKDRAIRRMMEYEGLEDAELVVFGDHENDLSMFRTADRAVATANATESLKAIATEIIESNESDSVARYIESDFRGREFSLKRGDGLSLTDRDG
jgi:Cof subfamily protein (haloacid dehalogenase superfamily)